MVRDLVWSIRWSPRRGLAGFTLDTIAFAIDNFIEQGGERSRAFQRGVARADLRLFEAGVGERQAPPILTPPGPSQRVSSTQSRKNFATSGCGMGFAMCAVRPPMTVYLPVGGLLLSA